MYCILNKALASATSASYPTSEARVIRTSALTLLLLCLGHFFIDLYSSALGAFQPLLVTQLGLSLRQAGIIGGVLIFFSSVMQPLYGYLSDRLHTRMFTVLAPIVAGVFISSLGLAPSFWAVLPMVALGGAGIASFHPQASAWASEGPATNKAQWMAVFISAGTLGMALGPTYFSSILAASGLRGAWWASLPGAGVTVVLLISLKLGPAPQTRPSRSIDWEPLKAVWRPLTIHYFLVFIRSIIQITFTQMLPLYLFRERGFNVQNSSYALTLYLFCGALGGFLGGHLADRFGGRTVIKISMLGSVPFLALFFLTDGIASLVGLALGGFLLLFTIPVNVVMAQELAPGQAGTISALMMGFAWGMAGLIFIPLVGYVSDLTSLHTALFALILAPIIGFFLTFRLPR